MRREPRAAQHGVALVEVVLVGLATTVLVTLVTTTFMNERQRAQERAAQSHLRAALVAARTIYADTGTLRRANHHPTGLARLEPAADYLPPTTPSRGPTQISVDARTEVWSAAILAPTGKCFWTRTTRTTATYGTTSNPHSCTGTAALQAVGSSW